MKKESVRRRADAVLLSLLALPCLLVFPQFMGLDGIWTSMPVSDFFAFVTAVLILLWYVRRKHLFHPQAIQ